MKVGDIYRITEKDIELSKEIDKRIKEAEERREEEYLLNGGMRVIGGITPELAEAMKEARELLKGHYKVEVVKGGLNSDKVDNEEKPDTEEEKTDVELNTEEIMETEDIEDGGKAIVIWPGTELHEFLMGRIIDTENYVKDRKNEILEALTELHFVGDAGTEQSRRVLFDYKYILDCMEDTELSLRAIDK